MSLAEDKELIELNESDFIDAGAAIEKWRQFPASVISHHGQPCCSIAREWLVNMDYSLLSGGNPYTGPRWLRTKYTWGPSTWPTYWCEVGELKTVDCGALAALAHELFTARGVTSYRVQLIQQYSQDASRHWLKQWGGDEDSVHWIKEDVIYHEGCAVRLRNNEIRIWDPTASWWVNPKQFGGYGSVLAVRLFAPQATASEHFMWGRHRIQPNQWQEVERARGDFA